jgi:NAD(P)-dependent dehydrogenase (short-subunit alcohol dehydrogenase family)
MMLLAGRKALVTGGAGRLGRAISAVLLREGAAVAISDVSAERLAAASAAEPAIATAITADVSQEDDVMRMVDAAEAAIGPLDVLVTAHGYVANRPVLAMDVSEWDQTFAVNVRGVMLCCREVARRWVERRTPGAIVNLSSGASRSARPGSSHYAASKAAVNLVTEVLATELGRHGIRVNAVLPGLVMDEPMRQEDPDKHPYINMMLHLTPLGRTGAPADIAEAVAFLASDRSAWTTGAMLEVTGGSHCGRTNAPFTGDVGMHPGR